MYIVINYRVNYRFCHYTSKYQIHTMTIFIPYKTVNYWWNVLVQTGSIWLVYEFSNICLWFNWKFSSRREETLSCEFCWYPKYLKQVRYSCGNSWTTLYKKFDTLGKHLFIWFHAFSCRLKEVSLFWFVSKSFLFVQKPFLFIS